MYPIRYNLYLIGYARKISWVSAICVKFGLKLIEVNIYLQEDQLIFHIQSLILMFSEIIRIRQCLLVLILFRMTSCAEKKSKGWVIEGGSAQRTPHSCFYFQEALQEYVLYRHDDSSSMLYMFWFLNASPSANRATSTFMPIHIHHQFLSLTL